MFFSSLYLFSVAFCLSLTVYYMFSQAQNIVNLKAFSEMPYQITDRGVFASCISGLKQPRLCILFPKYIHEDFKFILSWIYVLFLMSSIANEVKFRKDFLKSKVKSVKHYIHLQHFICANRPSLHMVFPSSRKTLDSLFSQISENPRLLDENTRMQYEWLRLYSFGFMSNEHDYSPIRLSRAGLYWSRERNNIICYSCELVMEIDTADLLADHELRSPNCRHILGTDERNVSISSIRNTSESHLSQGMSSLGIGNSNLTDAIVTSASNYPQQSTSQEAIPQATCVQTPAIQPGNTGNGNTVVSNVVQQLPRTHGREVLSSLGINLDRPRYPAYAVLTVRISSYQGWPPYVTQKPKAVAVAGFFYAGYEDYVKCFFCGGGLRNWEDGDDPWVEHARWFPRCAFLLQNRGQDFVMLVQEQHQALYSSIETEETEEHPRENQNAPTQSLISQGIEIGFPRELILSALQRVTSKKGDVSSVTVEDVIDSILENQHDKSQGATSHIEAQDETKPKEKDRKELVVKPSTTPSTTDDTHSNDTLSLEARSLMEENLQLKRQLECKICLNGEANVALLPCGHLCCCIECAPAMRKCPICRKVVRGTLRTYPT